MMILLLWKFYIYIIDFKHIKDYNLSNT